ncbi:MAG: copper chaperone [Pseudomonas sp.]|nr:copper chaperone [Pseudomonas sp.]
MQQFRVQGMTCGHCVRAVTEAIRNDDPSADVSVDLTSARVQVNSTLSAERVIELIGEEGYQASIA